ncbi:MAG: ATP-binding protein, partial [Phycisphaerae bacterium]|nr:ATP-binding protein [Phycisphaerae bacterium]
MIHQFYLDTFQRLYKRGLDAYRKGEMQRARRDLLRSAEMLLKLAAGSEGELRRTRKAKARQILELAKSIDPKAPAKPSGTPRVAVREGESTEAAAEKWIVSTVPDVRMEDVAGLEDVKATIRKRVIYPFQHPEITRKYRKRSGGGVLLYGPPGTGKTMIAKAIAAEVDATFFSVKCSDVMSKWVGEAERNLKKLFAAASEHPRAVVFMDETEAI